MNKPKLVFTSKETISSGTDLIVKTLYLLRNNSGPYSDVHSFLKEFSNIESLNADSVRYICLKYVDIETQIEYVDEINVGDISDVETMVKRSWPKIKGTYAFIYGYIDSLRGGETQEIWRLGFSQRDPEWGINGNGYEDSKKYIYLGTTKDKNTAEEFIVEMAKNVFNAIIEKYAYKGK